jgi:WD40 repeat protein
VFARGNRLLAAPFDLDALRLAGDPVVVLDGVAYESFGGATASLSDAGDLVYAPGTAPRRHLVWVTRDGRRAATGSPLRDYQPDVRLSPDGRHVAVPVGTGDHVAWVFTFDSGTLTPLFSRSDAHGYAWSPDSRRMAIPWYTKGLVIADRDLAREPDVVVPIDARSLNVWTWSPQGSTVVYSVEAATSRHDLIALNVGDRTSRTLLSAPQGGFQAAFSPDGRWLAYVESAAGRRNVFVTDYPGLRLKTPVSIDAGVAPVWSHDGRELFYLRGMTMMSATRRAGDDLAFGRPVELFETALPPAGVPYSVASDGRFLMVEDADPPSVSSSQLTLVLNWFDELRRLVPR